MIKIDRLTKKFGQFAAVSDLTLNVEPGEVFGFLGVNGAGKTTTLRMLVGVLEPTSGAAFLGGFNVHQEAQQAKQLLGYIPDRPHLYGKLTAREYLYFCADLHEVPPKEADKRIDQLLSEYALSSWENELIDGFSHGMKQRLATCGALIHSPKVLVVDEPMVGLDPHGAKLMKNVMKRYAAEGMSVLLSTHSLHVAEEVCNRLGVIDKGQLIAVGTLQEIRDQAGIQHGNLENLFLQITSSVYNDESSST